MDSISRQKVGPKEAISSTKKAMKKVPHKLLKISNIIMMGAKTLDFSIRATTSSTILRLKSMATTSSTTTPLHRSPKVTKQTPTKATLESEAQAASQNRSIFPQPQDLQ
jgi:hypothetical protein